jgi:CHAT domain-containing protein/tetratricopeptide (TPR) repeat protein
MMHEETTMLRRAIASSLLFGALTLFGDAPDSAELRQRAQEVVAAFQAGQLEWLMKLWSPSAPSRTAGRRRLTILMEERSALDLSITDVLEEGARGLVQIELRRNRTPSVSLGRYTLEFKLEEGQWRIWTMTSSEAEGARQLLEASPEQRDRLITTSPPTVALTRELLHSAIEYLDAGEIEKSVPVLALAADLAERTGDGVTRASAERTQGRLAIVRGDSAAAAQHFENSLRLSESSGDRRGVARSLTNLANIDRMKGNYERAESRFRTALDIYLQDGDRPGQANVLNNLGTLRTMQGDYPDAAKKLEEGLTIFRELNDTAGQARALNNLGIVLRAQGAYREALEHYQKALQLNRDVNNLEGIANALGNSGNLYMTLGNYVKALEAFQEGLAIGERIGSGQAMALGLSGIGEIYLSVGNYAQALEYLEKSYAVAERRGNKQVTAFLLHEIGMVRALQGDLPRALEYYQKSLTAQTEMGNRAEVAINLKDIGKVHAQLGKQDEARTSFERSLEIAQQINDRLTIAAVLVDLAELAKQPEEYEWGLDFARRAMKITVEMGLADEIWGVHLELGRFYRRMNRLDEARAEIETAIAIVERLRRGIPGEEMAQSAFESMVLPYHEMVGMLVARGDFATAFEYTERAKGRVLLDVMHQGRSDVSRAMTDAERVREKELVARLVQLNRDLQRELTSAGSKTDRVPDLRTKLGSARLEYEAFLTGLYVVHPQLRIERGEMIPIRATELGSLLAHKAADVFLEFVVTEEATYLFALSGNGTPGGIDLRVHTIAITRKELEDEARRFRESLAGRDLTYAPAARALFDKLLRPVEDQLRDAKQICIIPDGPLWELPFQALQPVHGRFLLDRHAIFYAPSITVLRETLARKKGNAHPARSGELLAFGNPVVPSEVASRVQDVYRDASLGPLPQAETEVRQIVSLYDPKESRAYVRKDAREEVVKTEAARFRVLHFATHGILDDQNPLYSRLLFSRSNSASEDGVLEAREIMRLDLAADLAVLSACETGRGRVGAGEGLIGVSWAFFVAGCPTTVVSQWKVSSASTTELMIEFHRLLRGAGHENRTRAEALRRAALKVRANRAYRHPFYWAAFVLIGDGQ